MRIGAAVLALVCCTAQADNWDYDKSTDKMTGKTTVRAMVISTESLKLDFPYKGDDNFGALTVRQHAMYGLDVVFMIGKGQLQCNTMECSIKVKFDDGPPMSFSGTPPEDRSTTQMFLDNPKRFIAAATKAKRILVQPTIYRNGSPVLEFGPLTPLIWPPK